ncbi:transcription factor HIVEP2a [Syngnathus scovelli]|uniref:transcription factor HIVEP2a n=1 Tax=Syngnathus scovelli TaxID=161590 RepID=UPI002110B41B|nr:transcription factor HIVEP2a [Syngnathus scovelli]XP_049612023.1 transcription factor HIVEP2a [Syngnathus scovelli]XP_049612024.1 transcription factor HIVEP2a [Syngnathus scovelli]
MEDHESNKDPAREKMPLQRKWASEPSAGAKRSTFADPPAARHRETSAPQRNYAGKLLSGASSAGAVGGPLPSQDPQGPLSQGFPGGYSYQLGPPYPQHPQTERFHSGAKPQPGLEAHAWPFAGQLPSDELYPVGHPGHAHSHRAGAAAGGRFPRQKSPSLPSSFVTYSQTGPDPGDEAYGKKEPKAKKPGKYICYYCGRACAKPSVLKKHIRSHTGERPYPCVPCGFSFKTKSNLYKHRKSHAHAIKAGLVPFSELAVSRGGGGDVDRASSGGDVEVHSDGEQSTDTDEEGAEDATVLADKDQPITRIAFEADKSPGGAEPAYADSAEELPAGSIKVPILIVPKSRGTECPPFQDIQGSHHALTSLAGRRGRSLDDGPSLKPRLALRANDKKGLDWDGGTTQSLNLLSPHSKGSTDSGYFSRSESAEQQVSPPNTNVKTYEEIMFGRTWYYQPNSRSRQFVTVAKISEDHVCLRGEGGMSRDIKLYPAAPGQSGSGLLEPPSDSGHLIRSNSMPTSSPENLSVPSGIRGSHSFDEMITSDDVLYQPGLRRLQRQAAIELLAHETHTGDPEGSAKNLAKKLSERSPAEPKVSMAEMATRKRRKKSVGDEDDSPDHGDSSCSGSVEMSGDYVSLDGSRGTPTGKGSLQSQSDSFDTCASVCSEDVALFTDADCRKAAANVISVIQHTNSISRPNSFDKSESFEQSAYHPSAPSSQYSEQSDSDIFEDALSPESGPARSESMDRQPQSDGDLASVSSSPGTPYHVSHKLVRQPNIQVPEIRVTDEKDAEAPVAKEPEKQPAEEFQLPQRSDTLSQMPSEKLPPKKKRLRLADMEHSSGESSFESTCTSLSRSPSQESNLSHSSSLDRDEGLKLASPTKQEDAVPGGGGAKASEFLTVPGSARQQREMRRSSSEQAPYTLPSEVPEMRSKSFDYGSLSSSRQGELYTSASAMKERRRGFLVRQASLSVHPEAVVQEPGGYELSIKQESVEQGAWLGLTGPPQRSSNVAGRTQRLGGAHQQHVLQHSISEDSLQEEPHYRSVQHRLQTQGSSSEGEHLEVIQQHPSAPQFLSYQQSALFWSQEVNQTSRQRLSLHKFHNRPPNSLSGKQLLQDGKPDQEQNPATSLSFDNTAGTPQQIRPMFAATQNHAGSLPLLVPVRIQTHVPTYASLMYTSVSQMLAHGPMRGSIGDDGGPNGAGFNLAHFLGQTDGTMLRPPHWKPSACGPNTGIPLSLTSGTVSTTDASGSGLGGGKRMLSPTSSVELFIETKQQKRVKEERMFGQMVKELSAVELSGADTSGGLEEGPASVPIPVRSSAHHRPHVPRQESFTPPLQIVTDSSPAWSCGRDSPEELDVDESRTAVSFNDAEDAIEQPGRVPAANLLVQLAVHQSPGLSRGTGRTLLLADASETQHFFQFPSLRTNSRVSWCFLNYTKPNSAQAEPRSSIYSSWCVSSYNPNPLNLSTKAALALLRSKQRRSTDLLYATADTSPPSSGKLVSSVAWKLRFDQLKPELMPVDVSHFGRKMKDRPKEEHAEKDVSIKRGGSAAEPTRIKIFEGGYKSNEDYVYVRGRGRGKYICEECGIRCKKPSMLKKHIRTHTDVRPYVCKFCNFAFKTKGNLTKHMKSKAHLKKCLELGVSTSLVDDGEADDADVGEEAGVRRKAATEHQFSDADDSEEDGDEVDDEDDEDDDCDGDSTPRTLSRSASPYAVTVATGAPQPSPPLFGYFTTLPSICITPQGAPEHPPPPPPMDQDLSQDFPSPSSRLSSPRADYSGCPSPVSPCSSPSSRQYLSPRRDASPLRHLSPKRDAGLCRRELSPRRGHMSLLAPLPRPTSPGKRDLSPRGRHKAMIRSHSPRRGLHQHLLLHSQQGGSRGLRSAQLAGLLSQADLGPRGPRRNAGAEMDTECVPGSPGGLEHPGNHGNQSSPPHQVLFSHLPLHSQLQVRSPFPMIPIGGIQMVHAVPTSLSAPLGQQGAQQAASRLPPRSSEDVESLEASAALERVGGASSGSPPLVAEVVREQEESIRTCTKAIASLRIDPDEHGDGRPAGRERVGGPPHSASLAEEGQPGRSPPSPVPPGAQHFSAPPRCPSPRTPADALQGTQSRPDGS